MFPGTLVYYKRSPNALWKIIQILSIGFFKITISYIQHAEAI